MCHRKDTQNEPSASILDQPETHVQLTMQEHHRLAEIEQAHQPSLGLSNTDRLFCAETMLVDGGVLVRPDRSPHPSGSSRTPAA
jgi:hypothetical protein